MDTDEQKKEQDDFNKKLFKLLGEFRDKEIKEDYCLYDITQISEAFRNGSR